jgi:hypothetical protein
MTSSHSGSLEARPVASITRSARTSSPSIARTPVTCGIPFAVEGPVSKLATPTPPIERVEGECATERLSYLEAHLRVAHWVAVVCDGDCRKAERSRFVQCFHHESEKGRVLDGEIEAKRVLHELARDLKLPKLTFQVIRRTIATLVQKEGTVKDVQGLMRHSRTATTWTFTCRRSPRAYSPRSTPFIWSCDRDPRRYIARWRKLYQRGAAMVQSNPARCGAYKGV